MELKGAKSISRQGVNRAPNSLIGRAGQKMAPTRGASSLISSDASQNLVWGAGRSRARETDSRASPVIERNLNMATGRSVIHDVISVFQPGVANRHVACDEVASFTQRC